MASADTEILTVYKIEIENIKSVGELRANIKNLKKDLEGLDIGSQEYQDTLNMLKVNQNALKDAMYATSSSLEDVKKAATGTSETYNSLVHRMASLKEMLRSTDVSTEQGKQAFADYARQIREVNDRLKEMDAEQGNYQRHVGHYQLALEGLSTILPNIPPSMNAVRNSAVQLNKSFKLMATNPIFGLVALVSPLINKIADGLRENETATAALKKAMDALKPVMDFFSKILDKIAEGLSKMVDWMVDLAKESNGTFRNIVSGAAGVGNAILQYLIGPFKTLIEVAKGAGNLLQDIFKGKWGSIKEDAKAAGEAIHEAFGKGWNFKQNFQTGQAAADAFIEGLGSSRSKKKAKDAAKAITEEVKDEFDDLVVELTDDLEEILDRIEKAEQKAKESARRRESEQLEAIGESAQRRIEMNEAILDDDRRIAEESYRIQAEANQKKLAALQSFQKAAIDRGDLDAYFDYEKQAADLGVQIELDALNERKRLRELDVEDARKAAESKYKLMVDYSKGVGDLLGAIADLYDVNSDTNKKSFENSKKFQLAETWVNTLSGMASAIWSTWNDKSIPSAIAKAALAATNAAGVLASGIATTAKIKSTTFGSASTGGSVATVAAPAVATSLPQIVQAQTASDVARINRSGEPTPVVLVWSEIEKKGKANKARIAEATF